VFRLGEARDSWDAVRPAIERTKVSFVGIAYSPLGGPEEGHSRGHVATRISGSFRPFGFRKKSIRRVREKTCRMSPGPRGGRGDGELPAGSLLNHKPLLRSSGVRFTCSVWRRGGLACKQCIRNAKPWVYEEAEARRKVPDEITSATQAGVSGKRLCGFQSVKREKEARGAGVRQFPRPVLKTHRSELSTPR